MVGLPSGDGCEDGDCAACSGITFDDEDAEDQN